MTNALLFSAKCAYVYFAYKSRNENTKKDRTEKAANIRSYTDTLD